MNTQRGIKNELGKAVNALAMISAFGALAVGTSKAAGSENSKHTLPSVAAASPEIEPLIIAAVPERSENENRSPLAERDSDECGWITDKPSGYYIGTVCKDDVFIKLNQSYSGTYEFGVVKHNGRHLCGWIEKGLIKPKSPEKDYERCTDYFEERENRYNIGKDFNCGDGKCVDGAVMELSEDCDKRLYRNYATSSPSPTNLRPNNNSGFYDYVGVVKGSVRYRFTKRRSSKKDGPAIVVGTDEYGWGYMSADCRSGLPRGGARKHDETVPGPNPNSAVR